MPFPLRRHSGLLLAGIWINVQKPGFRLTDDFVPQNHDLPE
jgi:hypothetical protein